MTAATALQILHEKLAWPSPAEIFSPVGAGPSVYARLASQKLADPMRYLTPATEARAGVLVANSTADGSEDPIGVVCAFSSPISDLTLREIHKLAWSFSRSKILVTVEPQLVRIWSCYERPNLDDEPFTLQPITPPVTAKDLEGRSSIAQVAELIHWAQIASGGLISQNQHRFKEDQRANKMLLENLRVIRRRLNKSLPESVTHDLLARLIFIQFLFQRKDRKGKPALHADLLRDLYDGQVLSAPYTSLSGLLESKEDTYSFFEWLDGKFNGDLFPDDWSQERKHVQPTHLEMLAEFVSGHTEMEDGQRCLWPLYSFDAIPLEFVSSIYEEFVAGGADGEEGVGEHYTRTELVDLVLDRVLPWRGHRYDLKILDPACGSGIFLVKAFQRLVHRWRLANRGKEPSAAFLARLLEKNIFGIDKNERAIRVASFSLYLAMCDEKDPRHYWTRMRFPNLRNVTLRAVDFFSEDVPGMATDTRCYDVVVGNAPWGDDSLSPEARSWAQKFDWRTADEQCGILFLPKAGHLTRRGGRICMIQSANALLFNVGPRAKAVRKKLFESFRVHEIINLSMRRYETFRDAVAPACVVSFSPALPNGEPIAYWSPKTIPSLDAQNHMAMDANDLNWVYPREASEDSSVWTALALGGRRDLELVRRLQADTTPLNRQVGWRVDRGYQRGLDIPYLDRFPSAALRFRRVRRKTPLEKAAKLLREALVENGEGSKVALVCYPEHAKAVELLSAQHRKRVSEVVLLGRKEQFPIEEVNSEIGLVVVLAPPELHEETLDLPILEGIDLDGAPSVIHASSLPPNRNPLFEHPRDAEAYVLPVAIVPESWKVEHFRFQCMLVQGDGKHTVAMYSQSFYGVHAPDEQALTSFAIAMKSSVLLYYLYMTGGRLAAYRPTVRKEQLENLPLPVSSTLSTSQSRGTHMNLRLSRLEVLSEQEIDAHAFELYALNLAERALVEDFVNYTLSDFKEGMVSAGREPVQYDAGDLRDYCDFLLRVLRVGFGNEPGATIFRPRSKESEIAYCLVAIHLESLHKSPCTEVPIEALDLLATLADLDNTARAQSGESAFRRRIARVYTFVRRQNTTGRRENIPTVYVIKPNQRRYWTRAAALRDADDIAVDIMAWRTSG